MTIIATRPTSGTELQRVRQDLLDRVEQRLDHFTDSELTRWRTINPARRNRSRRSSTW
ncbi:hypothetical protein NKG94_31365 [Micromonospora sp. M12]